MSHTITRIELGKGNFGVNAYLVETPAGFVLVDTGMRNHRLKVVDALRNAGVTAQNLRLIVITHGDMDHVGSAAFIHREFRAPIAMSEGDIGMTRDGDMFFGRSSGNRFMRAVMGAFRLAEADRFSPDLSLFEGIDLAVYGLGGVRVLELPGHSAGSIALLFENGSLICGDLFENRKRPSLGSIMDDVPAAQASAGRLPQLQPGTVYPGHGSPFNFNQLRPTDVTPRAR